MLIMAIIIIPVGISNVYLALQLGLVFECVSSIFFLCLFIAFCLFEVREFIREYSWYYEEAPVEGMHDTFKFPLTFSLAYAVVLIAVPLIITLVSMKSFSKEALVERLRGAEC